MLKNQMESKTHQYQEIIYGNIPVQLEDTGFNI